MLNKLERNFLNSTIEKPKTLEDLKIEKTQLQIDLLKQKQQEKNEKEAERLRIERQKRASQNSAVALQVTMIILKICFWICFAPILAVGFFFIGFFKAFMK